MEWRLTTEELCICEQFHEMGSIPRFNVIALQMERDIAERRRIAIDIKSSYTTSVTCGAFAGA